MNSRFPRSESLKLPRLFAWVWLALCVGVTGCAVPQWARTMAKPADSQAEDLAKKDSSTDPASETESSAEETGHSSVDELDPNSIRYRHSTVASSTPAGVFGVSRPRVDNTPRLRSHQDSLIVQSGNVTISDAGEPPPAPGEDAEPLPPSEPEVLHLPGPHSSSGLQLDVQGERISLNAREVPLNTVLGMLAQRYGLNIVASDGVRGSITLSLTDVKLDDALTAILEVNGYSWVRRNNILIISRIDADAQIAPHLQGREVRYYPLNFVSALEVDIVVKGLLSPVGKSFVMETSPQDKRRTHEQLVVEDLPAYLDRITEYVCQIDQPPRQVLIQAHILQVDLKDEYRHGVNFKALFNVDNARVSVGSQGFANPLAAPGFLIGIDGTDLDAIIEALRTTNDAKTLASPQVLALNGQEARIQIGAQLGFLVTTTTQTSTLQNVNFLDVGVVLSVTPIISESGQVMMTVKPEVSKGQINSATGLPEEETTEVETTVMLNDGQGMIIGGLIKEEDKSERSIIPFLGNVWFVGNFFRRSAELRNRSEIIIVLVPHILPSHLPNPAHDQARLARVNTRLFDGPLNRVDRRALEPQIPDTMRPRPTLRWKKTPATPPESPVTFPPLPPAGPYPTQMEALTAPNDIFVTPAEPFPAPIIE